MKAIFKYENGAEEVVRMKGELFPEVFSLNTPEGVRFYFAYIETLPSGTILFKETTAEEAQRIWYREQEEEEEE
jgi:hypothetical protein